MHDFFTTFFYSGIAGFATILGIVLVLYYEKWSIKNSVYLISFAAGTLLAGAFFNIIPESIGLYSNSLVFVLVGFLVFYLIENIIMVHSCDENGCPQEVFGTVSILGLGFHSLLDGVAIGLGFEVGFSLGLITTLAVVFHEFPEGISSMAVMIHSGVKRSRGILYSLIVALATPIGAIASFFFFESITAEILGILLALAAGSFLYVASASMIPEMHKKFKKSSALILFLGVGLIYLLGMVL